jgi:hypothetical protein
MKKTYGRIIIRPCLCALAIAAAALVSFIACSTPEDAKNESTPTGTAAPAAAKDETVTVRVPLASIENPDSRVINPTVSHLANGYEITANTTVSIELNVVWLNDGHRRRQRLRNPRGIYGTSEQDRKSNTEHTEYCHGEHGESLRALRDAHLDFSSRKSVLRVTPRLTNFFFHYILC